MKVLGLVIIAFLLTTTLFLLNGCGINPGGTDSEEPKILVTVPGNLAGFELPSEAIGRIGTDRITDIKFLKDPSWIIASNRFSIQIYKRENDNSVKLIGQITGHPGEVETIALSPDGKTLVAGCADGTIRSWKVDQIVHHIKEKNEKMVEGKIVVFTERNGIHTDILRDQSEPINAVTFSPDGKSLVSASDVIKLWKWDNEVKEELKSFGDNYRTTTALAFSKKSNKLVSGSSQNVIQVWSLDKNDPLSILNLTEHAAGKITALTFSPTASDIFASSGTDGKLLLWNIAKKNERPVEVLKGKKNIVYTVAFANSEDKLATGGEGKLVQVWDISTAAEPSAELLHKFEGHQYPITVVVFSEADDVLASGDSGGTIFLWKIP